MSFGLRFPGGIFLGTRSYGISIGPFSISGHRKRRIRSRRHTMSRVTAARPTAARPTGPPKKPRPTGKPAPRPGGPKQPSTPIRKPLPVGHYGPKHRDTAPLLVPTDPLRPAPKPLGTGDWIVHEHGHLVQVGERTISRRGVAYRLSSGAIVSGSDLAIAVPAIRTIWRAT